MSSLAHQAEVQKLALLLGVAPAELGFLDKLELVREPDPPTSLPAPPSDEKPKADEVEADKGDEGKDEKPKAKGKK